MLPNEEPSQRCESQLTLQLLTLYFSPPSEGAQLFETLLLSVLQLLLGFSLVGACVAVWYCRYTWFADNRELTNTYPRSATSWNTEHEFFDTITEYHNDFSGR